MAILGMMMRDRALEYQSVDLLPDLVEDVLFVDILTPSLEEAFLCGLDDWWGDFTVDMCL